ncbi:MAG: PAS domain S-box protein [Phycisphaerales bacterium]|nr:MAG: PAS domain S-box protein [Phycisphaerales bacterium]
MKTTPTTDMPPIGTDAYYRQLCEHLGVALIAVDLDLNIRVWNAAAARTFGAAAERMFGTPVARILPQERREMAERTLRRAIDTGETIQFEFQHRDPQGERRELAGTIAPVVSESGVRTGASVCIRDITRRISLQSDLSESRKMVALGEMAGAIAHHFNNILGGMVTSIDYANASDDAVIKDRVFDQVGRALQRATTLVNGLLAFAEGDRRANDLSDLTEIINDLADEIEEIIEGSHIEFTLNLPELPAVPVARVQVTTILRNIIQNAIEAMPDGGSLWVDISVDSQSVIILIGDTGCGLDETAKSRIFEPFWTTKGPLAAGTGGATGLGLAITHGLVNMIGGTISVTSEVGKGSCFRVTLPRPDTA